MTAAAGMRRGLLHRAWLTWAVLAVVVAVFALEVALSFEPVTGLLQPSLNTVVALGGLNSRLVLESGESYRLLTAIFLHADALHLLMNGIALVMIGPLLEAMVGRAWFLALFFLGGLCGSFASLLLSPANVVSMGASGAIMGLFSSALVCSFRLAKGPQRSAIQGNLLRVLIPSMLPLATVGGHQVDIGAHLGGALGGAGLGLVLLRTWSSSSPRPAFGRAAAVVALAGAIASAASFAAVATRFGEYRIAAGLIPGDRMPSGDADAKARSAELVEAYPGDPRSHWFRALALLDASDSAGAEAELRAALDRYGPVRSEFQPAFERRIQGVLAIVVDDRGRTEEAKGLAQPLCKAGTTDGDELRTMLDQRRLCD